MTYLLLFIGMFFFHETVLLPAVYLSLENEMSILAVVVLSIATSLIADLVWYFVAHLLPIEKLKKWHHIKRRQTTFDKLTLLLNKHQYPIIFASKFIYGTRLLVQIICGLRRTPIFKYFVVNLVGTVIYTAFLYGTALGINMLPLNLYLRGFIFIALILVINLIVRTIAQKRLFRPV